MSALQTSDILHLALPHCAQLLPDDIRVQALHSLGRDRVYVGDVVVRLVILEELDIHHFAAGA
jgi:hypothetical protein